jgi:hypothetical protein
LIHMELPSSWKKSQQYTDRISTPQHLSEI